MDCFESSKAWELLPLTRFLIFTMLPFLERILCYGFRSKAMLNVKYLASQIMEGGFGPDPELWLFDVAELCVRYSLKPLTLVLRTFLFLVFSETSFINSIKLKLLMLDILLKILFHINVKPIPSLFSNMFQLPSISLSSSPAPFLPQTTSVSKLSYPSGIISV